MTFSFYVRYCRNTEESVQNPVGGAVEIKLLSIPVGAYICGIGKKIKN